MERGVKERPSMAGGCEVAPRCIAGAAGAGRSGALGTGHSLGLGALDSSSGSTADLRQALPLPLAGPQCAYL